MSRARLLLFIAFFFPAGTMGLWSELHDALRPHETVVGRVVANESSTRGRTVPVFTLPHTGDREEVRGASSMKAGRSPALGTVLTLRCTRGPAPRCRPPGWEFAVWPILLGLLYTFSTGALLFFGLQSMIRQE